MEAYHILIQYNNNKQNIVVYCKIWKKYSEIQLDLNNRKMTNHPPSPDKKL